MRKVFISYSHRLDQDAADRFASTFADRRDAFIDKSVRSDLGDWDAETIKRRIKPLIANSSVTVVLVGEETGGRSWVDWEIYNSLRKGPRNDRNALLGILIPNKRHWIPDRLMTNEASMGLITDWPRDYRSLEDAIEYAYLKRTGEPDLSDPLRQRNATRSLWG